MTGNVEVKLKGDEKINDTIITQIIAKMYKMNKTVYFISLHVQLLKYILVILQEGVKGNKYPHPENRTFIHNDSSVLIYTFTAF